MPGPGIRKSWAEAYKSQQQHRNGRRFAKKSMACKSIKKRKETQIQTFDISPSSIFETFSL